MYRGSTTLLVVSEFIIVEFEALMVNHIDMFFVTFRDRQTIGIGLLGSPENTRRSPNVDLVLDHHL